MQENIHEVITRQTKRDTELNTIVVPFHLSSGTENNFWIIFIKKLHLQGALVAFTEVKQCRVKHLELPGQVDPSWPLAGSLAGHSWTLQRVRVISLKPFYPPQSCKWGQNGNPKSQKLTRPWQPSLSVIRYVVPLMSHPLTGHCFTPTTSLTHHLITVWFHRVESSLKCKMPSPGKSDSCFAFVFFPHMILFAGFVEVFCLTLPSCFIRFVTAHHWVLMTKKLFVLFFHFVSHAL